MTTQTQARSDRHPLVARWELVTDAHGRTRPQMRWEVSREAAAPIREDELATLAA